MRALAVRNDQHPDGLKAWDAPPPANTHQSLPGPEQYKLTRAIVGPRGGVSSMIGAGKVQNETWSPKDTHRWYHICKQIPESFGTPIANRRP